MSHLAMTASATGAPPGMSIEAIRWALRDAPGVPAQCVSVLLGLAEHADKHGRGTCPSTPTLAAYARKSVRQVQYDLDRLTDAKLIRLGDQSRAAYLPANRRTTVYDLAMDVAPGVQPTAPQGGVQSASPVQPIAPQQPTAPLDAADQEELPGVQPTAPQEPGSQGCNPVQPGVQPIAGKPKNVNQDPKNSSRRRRDLNEGRDDAMRLCAHLADRVEANGSLRPEIGKKWLDAARLMLDSDGRTEDQIRKAIDWCQDSEFWRSNVMAMPKLREQYDQLRLKAQEQARRERDAAAAQNGTGTSSAPGPDRARGWIAAGQAYQAQTGQPRKELT